MHAKVVKSISLEDNGDIKRGDTVWMIAIQAKRNGHYCKYVSDAVFTSRKEASEAVVKVHQEMGKGNVKMNIDKPNTVELVYVDLG